MKNLIFKSYTKGWPELKPGTYSEEDQEFSKGINLLISILLLYPEINFVKIDYSKKRLHFSFMIKKIFSSEQKENLSKDLTSSLVFYKYLHDAELHDFAVAFHMHENEFTQIELIRNVTDIEARELALIVSYFHQHFAGEIILEGRAALDEVEKVKREKLIDRYISDLKSHPEAEDLIGFREAGRVLVFNR